MLELIVFVLITTFGYLLLNLVNRDIRFLERLALAYLLGTGLITLLMFFYSWLGIKITPLSLVSLLAILIVALGVLNKVLNRKLVFDGIDLHKQFTGLKWYEKVLCAVITLILSASLILSVYYPVSVWDALALYDFVAKVITQTGYIVQIADKFNYFVEYPLLVSLTHSLVYLFKGTNPQFFYSLSYVAFTMICYSFIRKYLNRFLALLFTLILISDPTIFVHSTFAYTNLPYTIYYVSGALYLVYALVKGRYDYFFISSLLIGLSTWVRSVEPFWVVGVLLVIIYSLVKRNLRPILLFLPSFFIIQQPWKIFQSSVFGANYGTTTQFAVVGKTLAERIDVSQIIEVSNYFQSNIISLWEHAFPIFVIATILNLLSRKSAASLVLLSIILMNLTALYIGVYVFSLNFPDWKIISDSATRLSMFFPPLIICYSAIVVAENLWMLRKIGNKK